MLIGVLNSITRTKHASTTGATADAEFVSFIDLNSQFPADEEKIDSELKRWDLANPNSKDCNVYHALYHVKQVIRVAGIDHIGFGGDYGGIGAVPKQLEDALTYPVLTQALLERG